MNVYRGLTISLYLEIRCSQTWNAVEEILESRAGRSDEGEEMKRDERRQERHDVSPRRQISHLDYHSESQTGRE